jgi:hypothetical protein
LSHAGRASGTTDRRGKFSATTAGLGKRRIGLPAVVAGANSGSTTASAETLRAGQRAARRAFAAQRQSCQGGSLAAPASGDQPR